MKVVTTAEQALDNIRRLNSELVHSSDLADRLGFVHAWYVDEREADNIRFGFSKFAGYQDLNAETYLRDYKKLDGRNTEAVLKEFFEELSPNSADYRQVYAVLSDWLGGFGKTPRKDARLMVLKSKYRERTPNEDRRLLELLFAVAEMLPVHQRHELRNSL